MRRRRGKYPEPGMGYIYGVVLNNEIRYIGQTKYDIRQRFRAHIASAKSTTSNMRKTPFGKWLNKHIGKGDLPKPIMLDYVPIEKLNEVERGHIEYGRKTYNLLNVADGGRIEGRKPGSKQTEEFCRRQSEMRSGFKNQNFRDRTGERYNGLTIIGIHGFNNGCSQWICRCDCGMTKIVNSKKLNRTKSCGCARKTRWTQDAKMKLSQLDKLRKRDGITGRFMA